MGLARALILSASLLGLAACGGRALNWEPDRPDVHVVRSGETLHAIAWRYGLEVQQLTAWNGLGDGNLIYPGQRIRLRPAKNSGPAAAPAGSSQTGSSRSPSRPSVRSDSPAPAWRWPTEGRVSASFGENNNARTGILIGGRKGQPVVAAAGGQVVYAGSGLIGYGKLIIIKHNDTYLSAYGHNDSLVVEEGQSVSKGQRIAVMGEGPGQLPSLHFEIRRNGEPVDPQQFLPHP